MEARALPLGTLGQRPPLRGNPFSPTPPATAHAARWWPNMSSGWPHRQVRMDTGRSRCKRLHRKTAHQCPGAVAERRPHLIAHKLPFQLRSGPLLRAGLWLVFAGWGAVGNSCQWEISKPASRTARLHCLTERKQVHGSSTSNPATMRSATVGCRCLTMRRESSQLAQCAAVHTRTALASPSPPAERAKVEKVCGAARAFGVLRI